MARIKVGCAEPSTIPPRIDHTYDGVGYMLRFSVESDNQEDAIMDYVDHDDGHDGDDKSKGKRAEGKPSDSANNLRWASQSERGPDPPIASDKTASADSEHKKQ